MRKIVQLHIFQLLIVVFISAFVGYFIGTNSIKFALKDYKPILSVSSKNPPAGQNLDMSLFYQVLDKVNENYYDKSKIDTNKMVEGAINGMLGTLSDPYTSFFPPARNTDFKNQLAGQFSGIGAELSMSPENVITVVAPIDGSPAQKAGIRAGDMIAKVNGEDTVGWQVSQAVDKIRGEKGTTVNLTVFHDKSKKPVDLKITRDTIQLKSVTSWVKNYVCTNGTCDEKSNGQPIAYIRLSQFGDNTNTEFTKAVNSISSKVQDKNGNKLSGVVLDLRNNPGGYLSDAVFISSEFIKNGVVVLQEDGQGNREQLSVSRVGTLTDVPIVVLINKGSASASEITAGALRDHDRAKLVGETSFGKGTVQQAVDLTGGGSIHVSVAKWLTPNGTWVNKKGLTPDVAVVYDASKSAKLVSKGLDNQIQAGISELLK